MKHQVHVQTQTGFRQVGRTRFVRAAAHAAVAHVLAKRAICVELSVRLTHDNELHELNQQYRAMNKPTDVLSFGNDDWHEGSQLNKIDSSESSAFASPLYIGDIVISMERCQTQARAGGHTPDEELALLVVHGTLHLLGFDHDTAKRKKAMWRAQAAALASLGIVNRVSE